MHVAVVGGGVFGTVIAWRLAVRGHSVALLEPTGFGHAGAASGDRSRLARALYDDAAFSASGHASLALWAKWSAELGAPLFEPTGVLYLNDEGEPGAAFRGWVDRGMGHARQLGARVEELDARTVADRWPSIAVPGLSRGVFEPGGGFVRAAMATRAFAEAAVSTGRVDRIPARATEIKTHGGAASGVAFAGGSIEAEAVVVAAGFEGARLIAPLAGDVGVRRVPHWTAYFRADGEAGQRLRSPAVPCWADLGNRLYGFPDDGLSRYSDGFKIAWHEPRRADDGRADQEPSPAEVERLRVAAERRFPALASARHVATFPCAYDATADESFRIGPVKGAPRLWFVGGLSGHGFKHAPAIGESIAAAVTGEPPLLDLAPFALR